VRGVKFVTAVDDCVLEEVIAKFETLLRSEWFCVILAWNMLLFRPLWHSCWGGHAARYNGWNSTEIKHEMLVAWAFLQSVSIAVHFRRIHGVPGRYRFMPGLRWSTDSLRRRGDMHEEIGDWIFPLRFSSQHAGRFCHPHEIPNILGQGMRWSHLFARSLPLYVTFHSSFLLPMFWSVVRASQFFSSFLKV
jgi:hypothetical protein